MIKFTYGKQSEYTRKSMNIQINRENSAIIDEYIIQEEGLNVLIPTA